MLKRKIESKFIDWLNSKDALLVSGARQVGKTYFIREFGKEHFESYIEINLFEHKEWIEILENVKDINDFYFKLSTFKDANLIEGKTLIFFDEIQHAKRCDLITLSKFLIQDAKYRFIFSGSLLGVELNNIVSWPVGYIREIEMFPMDFEEFISANGLKDNVFNYLKECFEQEKEVDKYIHERIIDAFYKYLIIGGMPEVVDTFIKTNDTKKVNEVQEKIIRFYKKDITQYASIDQKVHLETIFENLPKELNSKNKRFNLDNLGDKKEVKNIQDDFMWLKKAGIAITTLSVDEPKIPLEIGANSRFVKLFSGDVGLLAFELMDTEIQTKLLTREKDINYGAIFENFVAQELNSHGFKSFYFNSKKQGEVDFLIEYKGNILPIEVKSGKDYKKHNALSNLLSNKEYQIDNAIVLSNNNISRNNKVLYLPIYMIMMFKSKEFKSNKLTLDLSGINI